MSLPRYPEYKPSGVAWLGDVPEHWRSAGLRWLSTRYSGGTPDKLNLDYWTEGTIPWLNSGEVNQSLVTEPSTYITEEAFQNSSAKWIPQGALVMALAGQGKTKGMVAQLGIPTTCNQSMAAIIPTQEQDARFLFWWLTSNYQNIRNMAGGDLRDGLNLELLGNIPCPLAPFTEQQSIAAFLDRETGKIDALIAEQRRLVELLAEKRQAVISHAVTKGLNPNAKMIDSGIEWLGEVPNHWKVKPLRRLISKPLSNGIFKKKDDFGRGTRLVNVFDIYQSDFKIKPDELERVDCTSDEIANYKVDAGDLFFVRSSLKQSGIAVVAVAEPYAEELVFECHLIRARPKAALLNPRYSSFLLNSATYRATLIAKAKMTTMTTIDQEAILSLALSVPPLTEQVAIATFLDIETAKFDTLTAEANRAIALLQERRSALISAAVTGKIDVRNSCNTETV